MTIPNVGQGVPYGSRQFRPLPSFDGQLFFEQKGADPDNSSNGTLYQVQIIGTALQWVAIAVVPPTPVNLTTPVLSGLHSEGAVLSCSTGEWSGQDPLTYTYQWERDNTPIGGATDSTYTILEADMGHAINCVVKATNSLGFSSEKSTIAVVLSIGTGTAAWPIPLPGSGMVTFQPGGGGLAGAPGDSYDVVVLDDTPVGYWRLGESAGTNAADESGNNHAGTYSGATLGQTGLLYGDADTAAKFPSLGNNMHTAAFTLTSGTNASWSFEALIAPDAADLTATLLGGHPETEHSYMGKHGVNGYTPGPFMGQLWSGTPACYVGNGSTTYTIWNAPSVTMFAGLTYHIVWTFGGTFPPVCYVNGTARATSLVFRHSQDISTDAGQKVQVGSRPDNVNGFVGVIDEVAVYNTALSSAQVAAHYAAAIAPGGPAGSQTIQFPAPWAPVSDTPGVRLIIHNNAVRTPLTATLLNADDSTFATFPIVEPGGGWTSGGIINETAPGVPASALKLQLAPSPMGDTVSFKAYAKAWAV